MKVKKKGRRYSQTRGKSGPTTTEVRRRLTEEINCAKPNITGMLVTALRQRDDALRQLNVISNSGQTTLSLLDALHKVEQALQSVNRIFRALGGEMELHT